MRTKYFKNFISIFTIVNYRNWLDASLLLWKKWGWKFVKIYQKSASSQLKIYRLLLKSIIYSQRWSARGRSWPRGHILKSLASKPQVLENCPVLGSRTALFFEPLKFCKKTPETLRKICEHLFCFSQLEHRRSQGERATREPTPPPPDWNFTDDKNLPKKAYCFFSFSFFLTFFACNSNQQQHGRPGAPSSPRFNFCQPI